MSNAAPLIIILVLVGGIVTWGALTDWTFSGLIPREGAKCTPDKDDKDENATEYVYDDEDECTVVKKCKKNWEPNESNTACIYSDQGKVCTTPVSAITNADTYKIGPTGVCNLVKTCKIGWKPSSAATTCVVNAGATCTANTVYIENAVTYKTNSTGVCNLAKTCKTGWKPSTDAKSCIVDVKVCTPPVSAITNATIYRLDADGKCTLVNECDPGWRPSDDSKTCVDEFEPLTTVKPYQMDGYYNGQSGTYVEIGKKQTVEECRKVAREIDPNALAFGVRTSKHGDPNYTKSCFTWKNGWGPDKAKLVGEGSHYTECLDKTKKPSEGCV